MTQQFKILCTSFFIVLDSFNVSPDSDVAITHANRNKFLLWVEDHGEGIVEVWVGDFEVRFEHFGVVGLVVVALGAHHER